MSTKNRDAEINRLAREIMEGDNIEGEIKTPRKHFAMLDNIYDDLGLTQSEHRLITHYIRRGNCFESVRTTAKVCRMNKDTVRLARESLAEKGLIKLNLQEGDYSTYKIEVTDIQLDGILWYTSGTANNPQLLKMLQENQAYIKG